MRAMQPASVSPVIDKAAPALPETFLSCYEIVNADGLRWHVRLYKVRRMAGAWQSHEQRGEIKQAVWTLRKKYQGLCRGYGFVVDVGQETRRRARRVEPPLGRVGGWFLGHV